MKDNIDINEKIVSNEFSFDKQDFKYFIGYKHNKEIRPLCILFPEISIYIKDILVRLDVSILWKQIKKI